MIFFRADMLRQGVTSSIYNLAFKSVTPLSEIRQTLQLSPTQTEVYLQKKLLLLNDIPVAVDITYILKNLGNAYAKDLKQQMTFPTLEQNSVPIASPLPFNAPPPIPKPANISTFPSANR